MTPQKLLAYYERGMFTDHEVLNRFIDLAVDLNPATFATFAADVPAEWMDELREMSSQSPPPRTFRVGSWCSAEPFDPEAWAAQQKAERERYVAGLRTWKAYFDAQATQG